MTFRGFLYRLARLLGDIEAVRKGRVGRRLAGREAATLSRRGLRKLYR